MALQMNKPFLQELNDPLFSAKDVRLFVKRDDLIHLYVSGNKWRKLKYNLEAFLNSGMEYLITVGGAYSNHVIATAAAGQAFGIKTIGIIRGDELDGNSNDALRFAKDCGMELIFVSREEYKCLHTEAGIMAFINKEKSKTKNPEYNGSKMADKGLFVLPEGGFNELAVKGCEEIVEDIDIPFDYICCACGTGATQSGIIRKLKPGQQAIGFAVLHGETFLEKEVSHYAGKNDNWSINFDYHFGGYAKTTIELNEFCGFFFERHDIIVEPIYTGKMFFGIYDLAKKGFFREGSTIIAVHTGGTAFLSEGHAGSDGRQNR
jgi:1-aminocyclopropane-1-carboxylate deaminase